MDIKYKIMDSCFKNMNGVDFGAESQPRITIIELFDNPTYQKLSYELKEQDRVVMVESCKRFDFSKPRNY